ncbi:asparagine synthase-related protein [Microbacterium sp. GXF0217]
MSDYIFVSDRNGRASGMLADRSLELIAALGYRAEGAEHFVSRNRRMAAIQFSRSTRLYSADAQRHSDESGTVTFVKGHVIDKGRDEATLLTADAVARVMANESAQGLRARFSGDYGICRFDGDEAAFVCDPLSMVSLFFHEASDGTCIVATRPRLIQAMLPHLGFDYRSLAWQAAAFWPLGDDTLVERVRRVPQGGWLRVTETGPTVHARPLSYLNRQDGGEMRAELARDPQQVLDRVIGQMAASLRAVLDSGRKVNLALTGGRDSRAIAALATIAGPVPPTLAAFSNGVPDHPDVIVAKSVAEAIGADFTNNVPKRSSFNSRDIFRQRLGAVFRYDGMVPIWDGGGSSGISASVLLQGHVGEIYRDKWFNTSYESPDDFAQRMFAGAGVDPNNLLRDEAEAEFKAQLRDRAQFYLDNGAQARQLGGVFRIEGMQSWESAQFSQGALWASHPVHPLYDPDMIDLSFLAPDGWRDDERIHYEITRRSQFNLADLPFAGHGWHRGLEANAGCRSVDVPPVPNLRQMVSASGWQSALFFSSPLQRRFLAVIDQTESSPLWEYFDKEATRSAIINASAEIPSIKMTRIYALLTSLCYAHGFELPLKFNAEVGHETLEARTLLRARSGATLLYDGRQSGSSVDGLDSSVIDAVPEVDVPDLVIDAVGHDGASFADEMDIYDLYSELRAVSSEKRKLEGDLRVARREVEVLRKGQTSAGSAAGGQR